MANLEKIKLKELTLKNICTERENICNEIKLLMKQPQNMKYWEDIVQLKEYVDRLEELRDKELDAYRINIYE